MIAAGCQQPGSKIFTHQSSWAPVWDVVPILEVSDFLKNSVSNRDAFLYAY